MPLSDKVCTAVVVGRRSADKKDVMGKTRALCEDVCENPLKAPFFQKNAWQIHCEINYMDSYEDTERNNVE